MSNKDKSLVVSFVFLFILYVAVFAYSTYMIAKTNELFKQEPLPTCTHMIDVSEQVPLCDGVKNINPKTPIR